VYKSLNKSKHHNPWHLSSQILEAVIIDNSFPKKQAENADRMIIEEQGLDDQALDLIHINVLHENVHIKDVIYWDSQDVDSDQTFQFAEGMTNDYLSEKAIKLPQEKVSEIVRKVQKQIRRQAETANDLKAQAEALIAFNGNQTNYKQKECILRIQIKLNQAGYNLEDTFDWEIDPSLNKPEIFAEQYVIENNLPQKFANEIASQIRSQLSNYLRKKLNNFLKIYEPKIDSKEEAETPEGKKKMNFKIKENIIHSLNENLESFPSSIPTSKAGLFLQNQELFGIVKKYSDYLSPTKKKVFQRQKGLFEQNFKKMPKSEPKQQQQQQQQKQHHIPQDITPPHVSIADSPSPMNTLNGKPHGLRPRSFKKNYRVLGGDLVNEPVATHHEESEADVSARHIQNTTIKGPFLPSGGGDGYGDNGMLIEESYNPKRHTNPQSRMVFRTNGKRYGSR